MRQDIVRPSFWVGVIFGVILSIPCWFFIALGILVYFGVLEV